MGPRTLQSADKTQLKSPMNLMILRIRAMKENPADTTHTKWKVNSIEKNDRLTQFLFETN